MTDGTSILSTEVEASVREDWKYVIEAEEHNSTIPEDLYTNQILQAWRNQKSGVLDLLFSGTWDSDWCQVPAKDLCSFLPRAAGSTDWSEEKVQCVSEKHEVS